MEEEVEAVVEMSILISMNLIENGMRRAPRGIIIKVRIYQYE